MPTIKEYKDAGYGDQEIYDYVSKQFLDAGYPKDQVDKYFEEQGVQVPKDVMTDFGLPSVAGAESTIGTEVPKKTWDDQAILNKDAGMSEFGLPDVMKDPRKEIEKTWDDEAILNKDAGMSEFGLPDIEFKPKQKGEWNDEEILNKDVGMSEFGLPDQEIDNYDKAIGYGAIKGAHSFIKYLDNAATVVSEVTGTDKMTAFKDLASTINPDEIMDEYSKREKDLPEKIISGVASAVTGEIPKLMITPGGPVTSFAIVGAIDAAGQSLEAGESGGEATKKAAIGGLKGVMLGTYLKATSKLPNVIRVPAAGGGFATATVIEGGTPEEIAESGAVGSILSIGHGKEKVEKTELSKKDLRQQELYDKQKKEYNEPKEVPVDEVKTKLDKVNEEVDKKISDKIELKEVEKHKINNMQPVDIKIEEVQFEQKKTKPKTDLEKESDRLFQKQKAYDERKSEYEIKSNKLKGELDEVYNGIEVEIDPRKFKDVKKNKWAALKKDAGTFKGKLTDYNEWVLDNVEVIVPKISEKTGKPLLTKEKLSGRELIERYHDDKEFAKLIDKVKKADDNFGKIPLKNIGRHNINDTEGVKITDKRKTEIEKKLNKLNDYESKVKSTSIMSDMLERKRREVNAKIDKDIKNTMVQDGVKSVLKRTIAKDEKLSNNDLKKMVVEVKKKVDKDVKEDPITKAEFLARKEVVVDKIEQDDFSKKLKEDEDVSAYKINYPEEEISDIQNYFLDKIQDNQNRIKEIEKEIQTAGWENVVEGKVNDKLFSERHNLKSENDELFKKLDNAKSLESKRADDFTELARNVKRGAKWKIDERGERYFETYYKDGTPRPRVYEKELMVFKNANDLNKGLLSTFKFAETAPRTFEKIGDGVKELVYRPVHDAAHYKLLRDLDLNKKLNELKKSLGRKWRKSSNRIGLYAIGKQENGHVILKLMKKDKPVLTDREMNVYNEMRAIYDKYYEEINKVRKTHGKGELGKVDNYFTWIREMNDISNNNENPFELSSKEIYSRYQKKLDVEFKYEKGRGKKKAPELETEVFDIMSKYGSAANKYIEMTPVNEKYRSLTSRIPIGDGNFYIGDVAPGSYRFMEDWMAYQNGLDIPSFLGEKATKALSKINRNIAFSVLSYNLRSALIQPSALRNSFTELGPEYFAKGVASLISPEKRNFAMEKSKHLKGRAFDALVNELFIKKGFGSRINKIGKLGMKPLQLLDMETAKITWQGAYLKAKGEFKFNEQKAINYADDVVIRTQASGARTDVSPIQRDVVGRTISALQTFVINDFGFLAHDVLGIKNKNIRTSDVVKKVISYGVATAALNWMYEDNPIYQMQSPFPRPIHVLMKSIKDKDKLDVIAMKMISELSEPIPIFGGAAKYGSSIPLLDTIKRLYEKEGLSIDQIEYVLRITGIPGARQAFKIFKSMRGGEDALHSIAGKYRTKKELKKQREKNRRLNF